MARHFVDFQTPIELCEKIIELHDGQDFRRVLEPTCGAGSFLAAAGTKWPRTQRIGIEIQESYLPEARHTGAQIIHASLFDMRLVKDLS